LANNNITNLFDINSLVKLKIFDLSVNPVKYQENVVGKLINRIIKKSIQENDQGYAQEVEEL
jgi:hypothetical protein